MLSVGSRDGRKGLGLGFGVGGEMEETELEEGEACYYQGGDTSIDPDVALSYIDEKLQDVLGHFQKDFEGGVSAENLGAKFGGYGSFLPTYQRSPSILSHPRSPEKVQNYSAPRSPNNFLSEVGCQNSTVPSSASSQERPERASLSTVPPSISRASSVDNSVKRDPCSYSTRDAGEHTPNQEPPHRSVPINSSDQKTLKVRIKVGPDNLAARKNAEIYSGLGLDISPSSSFEDSPAESGGISPESHDSLDKSPMRILQIMTSFSVPGGQLLSPLPDSLLHLMEKEKLLGDGRVGPARKGSRDNSLMEADDPSSMRRDGKLLGDKKMKPVEKNGRSVEVKNENAKDSSNDISALLKKEIDIETPAGRELVSNALKISIISNLKCPIGETAKGVFKASDISREANKDVVKDKYFSPDFAKEEGLELASSQDLNRVEKRSLKMSSTDKVCEDKKDSFYKDASFERKKDRSKDESVCGTSKVESDALKGGKDLNGGSVNPPKQKVGLKSTSQEQDGANIPQWKEQSSSGGKRKSKGSQSNGIPPADLHKERLRVDSGSVVKEKRKNTSTGDYSSKSKIDGTKLHKEKGKIRDGYRDVLGDVKVEQSECRLDSVEMPFKDRQKNKKTEAFDKEFQTSADKTKERSIGKKPDSSLTHVEHQKAAPMTAPALVENGPISDGASATVAAVLIQDNWVCCDKCQKWRLLPYGIEPEHLPKKWKCSMLTWLPGMNRCNISEEETTKAVQAYQAPFALLGNQNNLQAQPNIVATGVNLVDVQNLGQNNQDSSLVGLSAGGKKKHGLKEASISNSTSVINFSNSSKKNQQSSVKSRSLNDVTNSPLESSLANRPGFQQSNKSGDFAGEKHMHKQKEKYKLPEHYSDGGDGKHMKNKRESDQEGLRASKKTKKEGAYYADEDRNSDHGGAMGRVFPCSSGSLPTKVLGKDLQKYNKFSSSKDSKCNAKDGSLASVKKPNDHFQVSLDGGSLDMGKNNKMDMAAKKRKGKEWQGSQSYSEALPTSAHHPQDSGVPMKVETSESELRKDKKIRLSKSDGRESSTSKSEGRKDKKGKVTRIILSGSRDQPVDGMEEEGISCIEKEPLQGQQDSLKRDSGFGQPSVAATSSSSKVSGSRKTKSNFQEVKGSPVESVSSSPLRIFNPDKLMPVKRNVSLKDETSNFGVSGMGSPRRCSDGEGGDGGSHRSGIVKKEKTSSGTHHRSLESSVQQDRDALSGKIKNQAEPSSKFGSTHLVNGGPDNLDQDNHCHEERANNSHYHSNGLVPRKSGKGSSRSKDKHRNSKSDFEKGKVRVPDSFSEQEELYSMKSSRYVGEPESHDCSPSHEEMRDGKYNFMEKCGMKPDKDEKGHSGKHDHVGKWSSESSRRENQSKHGVHEGSGAKLDPNGSKDGKPIIQQNMLQEREGERSSNWISSDRTDRMEIPSGRGKSHLLTHSGDKQEPQSLCGRIAPGSQTGSGSVVFPVDASGGGEALKAPKHPRKPDNQNGSHSNNVRYATPNGIGVRDLDAPSPLRKDSSSQAAAINALKEAKNLKHTADRLKNSASYVEATGLYFQAALKFLHGASLLECSIENIRYGEQNQSMHIYSSTAALCEFCAREYEKYKDMAAASLAYKCMEVAYMKVIYFKHSTASKDQTELHGALQMVPPGESPSSSASDVDNLTHQGVQDKIASTKSTNSPHFGGNHVIVARNRPRFEGLLNFAKEAASAMEASRKAQNAFAAASVHGEEGQYVEAISSVKRVLDFSFHDVEGFLRLVRVSMEAINH
ncbi:PREDICTED: uncharacterized protein LOC104599025 [Nelumbo nucifera]|uniref:Uncharacterized protein LOC104599025 n=1 Tax=Nelumbo nucifera TaxID=4432 RepID=A0A1U8A0L1_NELNU|nr:PREDICTED: uncharacterized protein LOC104599025 [Nelumbo nucifera]XP_010259694.1 PREDICTED: uncharacterized protein LOC104599025 [Nelumbo nucifera]XP_019053572.1 PREDICTED: uncharacterized protein LOC104599025 [Nelumbo nucifera]XP_019053573.1 PREDICTED: uncharacterized protein LOC104599025 [Nelumbo nucifera]